MDDAGPPPAASVDHGGASGTGKSFLGLSTPLEIAVAAAVVLVLVMSAATIAAYLTRRRGAKRPQSSRVDHALSSGSSLLPTSTPKQQQPKYVEVGGAEVGTSSSDVASSSAAASSLDSPVKRKVGRISGAAPGVEMGWGRWYELEELEAATGGFRQANVVGEGGYGTVYRGVLADGEVVAVKFLFDHK
jgi:hypothetical protein